MAQREFPIEFRGVSFAVTVEYHEEDVAQWILRSAKPQDDDANFAGFLMADDHTCAEFDRLCDLEMQEFRGTRGVDVMDAYRSELEREEAT